MGRRWRPERRSAPPTRSGGQFNPGRAANLGAARERRVAPLPRRGDGGHRARLDPAAARCTRELPGVGAVAPRSPGPTAGWTRPPGSRSASYDPAVAAMQGFPADCRRLLRLAPLRPRGLGAGDGLPARPPRDFDASAASRRPTARQHQELRPLPAARGPRAELRLRAATADRHPLAPRPQRRRRLRRRRPRPLRGPVLRATCRPATRTTTGGFFRAAADYALPPFGGDPQEIAPAGDRRMRVLFLHFGEFHVNSVIQAFHLGEEMTAAGIEVALCGQGPPGPDRDGRGAQFRVHRLRGPRAPAAPLRRASRRRDHVCAWTPREVVRKATERAAESSSAPYVVHLEDNEEHLLSGALRLPYERAQRLPRARLDRLCTDDFVHPSHYPRLLERRRAGSRGSPRS